MMINLFSTNIAYASLDSIISSAEKLIINPLIIFMFALALVLFLYGIIQFISNQENEEKRTAGKNHMMWGLIGLTIMIGVWFLLNLILSTFNITGVNPEKGTVNLNDYNPSTPKVGK